MQSIPSLINQPVSSGIVADTSANVNQIIAGFGISVSPAAGTGNVTVSANPNSANSVGFKDDWLAQVGSTSITTATSTFGDTAWGTIQIVGGTQTLGATTTETFANPGQLAMTTSATSGQGIAIYKNGNGCLGNLAGNAGWEYNGIIQLGQTTTIAMRIGMCAGGQQAVDPPTGGIWVQFDTANAASSANLTYTTASASAYTFSNANAVLADTNFHHFKIRSLVAGTVLFSVDGGTETAIATNLPTVSLQPFVQLLTRTTAAVKANVDFVSYSATNTRT